MKKRNGISTLSAQLTSTMSVALVLLLLGVVGMLGIAAHRVTDGIKENMGFSIIMAEEASDAQINAIKQNLACADYVASYQYHSPEDAMHQWQRDTGEDLLALCGVNPFAPELEVKVKPAYADVASLRRIAATFSNNQSVEEVTVRAEMIESVNQNLQTLMMVLGIAAAALALISSVLINNTVRLTIYARRFLIHTMKLVGATRGFIRRPFIVQNAIQGLIAAIVASVLLCGIMWYVLDMGAGIDEYVDWNSVSLICAGMMIAGVILCTLAAWWSTNKYLTLSYDDLFN
ncbi:MAG: permease-like cell division protein FtsX [Muribaculaceae bacterium]|nr:permease-like cell division protein FtsX [Muribaculaceae bacterium]